MISLLRTGSWLTLAGAGLLSLGIATDTLGGGQAPDLAALSAHLGPLTVTGTIAVEEGVLGELPPESFVFLGLEGNGGVEGELFSAWYERDRRWSGRPHDLVGCFEVLGFETESVERLRTESGASVWLRTFAKEDERRTVVHWLQRPGSLPGARGGAGLLGRLTEARGLRQDVVSVYLSFPAEAAPNRGTLAHTANAVVLGMAGLLAGE